MVKALLIFLALCLVPTPAYAHGIEIPGGVVLGVFGTLVVSIGAACGLQGTLWQRTLYFLSGLAGSAFCCIILMNIIILLVDAKGRRECDYCEMFVAGASILAGLTSAVFAHSRMQEQPMLAMPSNRFLLAAWGVLAALSIGATLFFGLLVTGYGRTFFAGTVAPFVSALAIAIAAGLGLAIKVDIKTDIAFRRLFIYWPFATLFVLLICDSRNFPGGNILQAAVWYALLLGYPVAAVVFTRKRLKQKQGGTKEPE